MKIGAAAWITAVSPESRCVSAKPSSQNGTALLSAPSTTERYDRVTDRPQPAATDDEREEHQRADDGAAEDDHRGLELVHAQPDPHEGGAPDGGEEDQQAGVTAGHVTTVTAPPASEAASGQGAAGTAGRLAA